MIITRLTFFVLGFGLVILTLFSAIQTFVLPRSAPDLLAGTVFRTVRLLMEIRLAGSKTYSLRDRVMAFYAPLSLVLLLPVWLTLILLGYAGMFWAVGDSSWYTAFKLSGSSLLTLGFSTPTGVLMTLLALTEATIGLLLVAILIAYLPTMYSAFSRREAAVSLLEVRAGNPPSAVEMIKRYYRIHGLNQLGDQWRTWETWFTDIAESHTSLGALVFFRSPLPRHSWVASAGAVLDGAALTLAVVDVPHNFQADLCIRAGYLALRQISDFYKIEYGQNPAPGDPISVTRAEFGLACEDLAKQGVPLKKDLEQAWMDYAGWRVNYDQTLLALAELTMAPESPWCDLEHRKFIIKKGGTRENG